MDNMYEVGSKIRLICGEDVDMPKAGTLGVITSMDVDCFYVRWLSFDAPVGCWVYPEEDEIEPVTDEEYMKEKAMIDKINKALDAWLEKYKG